MRTRTPDWRLKCCCGRCKKCRARLAERKRAEDKAAGVVYVPKPRPRKLCGPEMSEHSANNHGGYAALESSRRLEEFFARRREAWELAKRRDDGA